MTTRRGSLEYVELTRGGGDQRPEEEDDLPSVTPLPIAVVPVVIEEEDRAPLRPIDELE